MLPLTGKPSFDDLAIGASARIERRLTADALDRLTAVIGGDVRPDDVEWPPYCSVDQPAGWAGALIAAAIAQVLPGAGISWRVQTLRFHEPIELGDSITATVTVTEKIPERWRVLLDCIATNQHGETVVSGTTEAAFPPQENHGPSPATRQ